MNSVPGVRGLFYLRAAALGWFVLSSIIWMFLPQLFTNNIEDWFRASALLWLILDAALLAVIVPFAQGQKGGPAETPARAFLILSAVALLLSIVQSLPELGGPSLLKLGENGGRALIFVHQLIYLAGEISLWLALVRSTSDVPPWGPAFYTLLIVGAVLSNLHVMLTHESYRRLFLSSQLGVALRWVRLGVGVGAQVIVLGLLRRLVDGGGAVASTPATPATGRPATSPGRDIAVGAIWLGAGFIITLVSYSAAAESGGGRYVVTSGAIAYGLVRLVRGFVRLGG